MTINNVQVKILNAHPTDTEGFKGYRIFMKVGTVLAIKWDTKSNPAVSECYSYDPQSITFQGDAQRPTICTATYKTGETLRGKIQLVSLNEDEQKTYDAKIKHEASWKKVKEEIERQAKEQSAKEQEQREANRALIRLATKGLGKGKPEKKNVSFSLSALKKVADFVRHDREDFPGGRSYKRQFEDYKKTAFYYTADVNTEILFKKAKEQCRKTIDNATGRALLPAKKSKLRKKCGK